MSVDSLVRRLDRLDHSERQAELVAHVRGLATAQAEALSQTLARGDVHERCLGLLVAQVRGDLGPSWTGLEDPSLTVRRKAARAIGRHASSTPDSLVDRVDPTTLSVMIRQVVRGGRSEIAESLVGSLIARNRLTEAASLLVACSPGAIASHLDTVAWPDAVWRRLAKHHPTMMVEHVQRAFDATAERHDLVWRRFDSGVWHWLAEHQPAQLADWIDHFADPDSLPLDVSSLGPMIRWSPSRVVDWLRTRVGWFCLGSGRSTVAKVLARGVRSVDDASLAPLCEALLRIEPLRFTALTAELPRPRRGSLFEAATDSMSVEHTQWPLALLDALPHQIREREAERMLALTRAQTDPSWRREVLGRLCIDEARTRLEQEGKAASASDRAEAHVALVRCTVLNRRGMRATLTWLQRIRNEQDPVRMAVVGALARAPGHLFENQVEDQEALDAVIAPIFEARDTSYGTRAAVATLAKNLMTAHASAPGCAMFGFGVSLLSRLAGQAGMLDLPQLHRNLPKGAEQAIVDALMPWLEVAQKTQREQGIFRLWAALGKRAWEVASLSNLVGRIIWHGHKSSAARAAALWLEDPRTRDARVQQIVAQDTSALYLHGVFDHCHKRRQSLLHQRFSPAAPRGRFHDGKVVFIPSVECGIGRWTPALQRRYLDLIDAAESDPKRYARTRAALVALRARVPLTTVTDLEPSLSSENINVLEAALGALAWTDAPAPALPILLDHVGGDRARVAMYAVPRMAKVLPAQVVVASLSELLQRPRLKVTVHKEALRLLGQYPSEAAVDLLRRTWSQKLHRDVRIAAIHAARNVLGRPEAWTLLESAATDTSADVARAVLQVPARSIARAHRDRYVSIMTRVADHPEPAARAALFGALLGGWAVEAVEPAVRLAVRVVGRLDPNDPWRQAVSVLVEGARSTSAHPLIDAVVHQLLEAAAADIAPAGERDQVPHQRLLMFVHALCVRRHPTVSSLLESIAKTLGARSEGWALSVYPQVAATPNEVLGPVVLELLDAALSPRSALDVEHAVIAAAELADRDWSPAHASGLVDTLIEGPAAARTIAARTLETFGPRWGWTPAWTARLARLRRDEDYDVRETARRVWITLA